jgi:hypothetical protein
MNLPEGYRIEEIPGGCRQHFPGGYREYHRIGGGTMTHTLVTNGRAHSHEELNRIFEGSHPFQNSKVWNERFPFQLRSRIATLEKELASQILEKKVFRSMASLAGLLACAIYVLK